MSFLRKSRWAYTLPLAAIGGGGLLVMAFYPRTPDWLEPSRAWAGLSVEHPLGCGEAGVDLLALVAHAEVHGIVLAVLVALVGFGVGTPVGVCAALARGMTERIVERTCDLLQGFPTFLLAMTVLSAVKTPNRWHLALREVVAP